MTYRVNELLFYVDMGGKFQTPKNSNQKADRKLHIAIASVFASVDSCLGHRED
jgi:hypothetical protein